MEGTGQAVSAAESFGGIRRNYLRTSTANFDIEASDTSMFQPPAVRINSDFFGSRTITEETKQELPTAALRPIRWTIKRIGNVIDNYLRYGTTIREFVRWNSSNRSSNRLWNIRPIRNCRNDIKIIVNWYTRLWSVTIPTDRRNGCKIQKNGRL